MCEALRELMTALLCCGPAKQQQPLRTVRLDMNNDISLNDKAIAENQKTIREMAPGLVGDKLRQVVVFGSCARGDYRPDSDMDVAVIIDDTRESMSGYLHSLIDLSTDIAMRNFSVVNFVCIPSDDYKKMAAYDLYSNIRNEGRVIYG